MTSIVQGDGLRSRLDGEMSDEKSRGNDRQNVAKQTQSQQLHILSLSFQGASGVDRHRVYGVQHHDKHGQYTHPREIYQDHQRRTSLVYAFR